MLKLNFDDNKKLCKSLGITVRHHHLFIAVASLLLLSMAADMYCRCCCHSWARRPWMDLDWRRALEQVLPFFQFYRGAEGQVAAFSASVAKVSSLAVLPSPFQRIPCTQDMHKYAECAVSCYAGQALGE